MTFVNGFDFNIHEKSEILLIKNNKWKNISFAMSMRNQKRLDVGHVWHIPEWLGGIFYLITMLLDWDHRARPST